MAIVYWLHTKDHTDIFKEGYVGVTIKTLEYRLSGHKRDALLGSHLAIHKAIRKYGDEIIAEVILEGEEDYCYGVECKLRPLPSIGYNAAVGGGVSPTTGTKHSEETRKKISLASVGRVYGKWTPAQREKMKKYVGEKSSMYGRTISEERRKKLSEVLRGVPKSLESRINYSRANSGEKNNMYGKTAYLDPKCNKSVWMSAQQLYVLYLEALTRHKKCGKVRLSKLSEGFTPDNLETITLKFRGGWIPELDDAWLEFVNKNNRRLNA